MSGKLITDQDLENFRKSLLKEIQALLTNNKEGHDTIWLKTNEVQKILKCSVGKLHMLRSHRKLSFRKIGGTVYYEKAVIFQLLKDGF